MAAVAAARKGGRTQQGNVPAPGQHAPGGFRPPLQKPPASAPPPAAAPPPPSSTPGKPRNQAPAPSAPAAPASSPGPGAARPAAPATSRASTATREGSGALLVLFAYPLAFNLLRHGPAGAKAWLAAKFINSPSPAFEQGMVRNQQPPPGGRPRAGPA